MQSKSIPALLLIAVAAMAACSSSKNVQTSSPQTIYDFANLIDRDALYADLAVLAHDSLQGRETGTIGEDKAADFLARRYREIGLSPAGGNNTFFQHFNLVQPAVSAFNYTVSRNDSLLEKSRYSKTETGNLITIFGGNDELEGPVLFAGAGILDTEQSINQFPAADTVAGSWILLFYEEGLSDMRHLQNLIANHNALGALLIVGTDSTGYLQEAQSGQENLGQGRGLSLEYLQQQRENISPAFNRIHPKMATGILGLKNTGALQTLSQKLTEAPDAFTPRKLPVTLHHQPEIDQNTIESQNVVALLEGTDPQLKHEVVVLSSHYDHVGIGQPNSKGDNIYNGADDDGSGTAATVQIAEKMMAAKRAGFGPRRSVLFLNVSAEEKGLLGSRYYSDHPAINIKHTVANINLDMIGRVDSEHEQDSNFVYVIGGEIISSGLDSLTTVANTMGPELKLSDRYNDLNDPNQFYRRSDHWNFGRLGVPFVFFFNGTHEDYHQPSDHIEKITFGPYTKRARLIYNLTALLANADERPEVDNQAFIEKTSVNPR